MTILIVGGGKMGLSHLALTSGLLGRKNVAICDASLALRFAYRRFGIRTFSSLSSAIQELQGKIAGAIVATPTPSHFPIAKSLLLASIPCFIEKPLTLRPDQSLELVDIATSKGIPAQVGFVLRYVATFVALRNLVSAQKLGAAISYRARMAGNVITGGQSNTWRSDFSRGGGCLNEYGPHLIDLCRYVFGEVSGISDAIAQRVHSRLADDRLTASWRHASGTEGHLELDWCDEALRKSVVRFDVTFQRARVSLDNSVMRIHGIDSHGDLPADIRALESSAPARVAFYLRGEEYSLQLEDFLGKCLGKNLGETPYGGSASSALLLDGLAVDRLIEELARRAALI